MRRVSALLLLILSATAMGQQEIMPDTKQVFRAYRQCMEAGTASFAKRATSADEAIAGSQSLCRAQRSSLVENVAAIKMADDIIQGKPLSEAAAGRHARKVATALDEQMKPDLVRTFMDAR